MTITPGAFLTVHLRDHARVTNGYRSVLVLHVGRKWIRLLYPPTLTALRVGADELAGARPEPLPRQRLRARLKHQAARHRRLGLPFSRSVVAEALMLLADPPREPGPRRNLGGPRAAWPAPEARP